MACDPNITVRADTTTCEFAQNVFYEYWASGESEVIEVFSPATQATYSTDCSPSAGRVTCRTADRGVVRFTQAAIDAYTQDEADRYAERADLGPDAIEAAPPSEAVADDCDPSYTGACLNPDSDDYDCEGGSGDGPDYTGAVEVVGDDHYDLDRDGDGVACEW